MTPPTHRVRSPKPDPFKSPLYIVSSYARGGAVHEGRTNSGTLSRRSRDRAVNSWPCLLSTADAPPARLAAEAALKSGREHPWLIMRLAGAIWPK